MSSLIPPLCFRNVVEKLRESGHTVVEWKDRGANILKISKEGIKTTFSESILFRSQWSMEGVQ